MTLVDIRIALPLLIHIDDSTYLYCKPKLSPDILMNCPEIQVVKVPRAEPITDELIGVAIIRAESACRANP